MKPIQLQPSKVEEIVEATCALHNWLRITSGSTYVPPGSYDEELAGSTTVQMGSWHSQIQPTGLVEAPPLRFGQNYPRSANESFYVNISTKKVQYHGKKIFSMCNIHCKFRKSKCINKPFLMLIS